MEEEGIRTHGTRGSAKVRAVREVRQRELNPLTEVPAGSPLIMELCVPDEAGYS